MPTYTAISPFQHPDGVVIPNETIDLTEDAAARGIESGTLVLSPAPAPEVPTPTEPTAPPVAPVPPAAPAAQQSDSKE